MAYRALYRDYRPQKFADIVGQQHITQTLQNAVGSNRVSHAYLFCGPRGTGKTTTAKVLAKTLNCLNPSGEEPCNQCANCMATNNGTSADVIEIDAASNRGIEDIRDLREQVKYSPANGKYRIYIIDEVHMLTTEAFNALLKTLEEPPEHVIFILATTEPQKVPLTILSRCQRFEFHRISNSDILKRLKTVADSAGLKVEEQALRLIARAAEGGLRDALSILDQASVFGGNTVTADDIHKLLGTVREDVLSSMAGLIACGNISQALKRVDELYQQGKDLRLFVKELNTYLRTLMLYLVSKDNNEELTHSINVKADAEKFSPSFIAECLEKLTRLEYDMKWSSQPRILLELALVKLADIKNSSLSAHVSRPEHLNNQEAINDIKKIERPQSVAELAQKKDVNPAPETSDESESQQKVLPNLKDVWHDILERVKKHKPSAYGVFREARLVDIDEHKMTIGFKPQHSNFHKMRAEQDKEIFEQAVSEVYGGNWSVNIITIEEKTNQKQKSDESEHPLVQKAAELFGRDKVTITNRN